MNHERWLISYSDFVTLLLAFFVVMYSISQVNESKYRILSDTLTEIFQASPKAIKPIQVGDPVSSNAPDAIALQEQKDALEENPKDRDAGGHTSGVFSEISGQLVNAFDHLVADDLLVVRGNESWLEIELNANILFASGSATATSEARQIFREVAAILAPYPNAIQVQGFTDNIPINNRRFPSNWELSAARAAAVVKLLADDGVVAQRLAAVGYGEFQPVADNTTEAGRSRNRRVVLMVSGTASVRPTIAADLIDETALLKNVQAFESQTDTAETSEGVNELEAGLEVEPLLAEPEATVALPDTDQGIESIEETVPDAAESEQPPVELDGIKTIELQGGGLLFTNDPEQ